MSLAVHWFWYTLKQSSDIAYINHRFVQILPIIFNQIVFFVNDKLCFFVATCGLYNNFPLSILFLLSESERDLYYSWALQRIIGMQPWNEGG